MVWSSVVGALGSIGGGLLSSLGAANANDRAADQAANNLAKAEEFAQKGLMWRAMDAMNAYKYTGIHPLAVLGVQGPTFSPVTTAFMNEGEGIGSGLARAGQDISTSIHRGADQSLRREELELRRVAMNNATERTGLENDLLRLQIASHMARLRQDSSVGVPVGSPDSSFVKVKPHEVTAMKDRGFEPGPMPDVGHVTTPDGSVVPVPSKDFKDRAEDMSWLPFTWFMRHYVRPWLNSEDRDRLMPKRPADFGKVWTWDGLQWTQQDRPAPRGRAGNYRGLPNFGIPSFGRR